VWSGGGRRRSEGVGIFGTQGACRRVVEWLGSGKLGGRCDLFVSERLRVHMLLRWHIGV
jgi:hypothetical protein